MSAGGLSTAVVQIEEPSLDGVKEEDRSAIREIISVLHSLQIPSPICKSWAVTVTPNGQHYDIIAHLTGNDCEVYLEDMEVVRRLDNPRFVSISVKVLPTPHIRVRVASRDVPVSVTECDIIRIRKRRWWSFGK